MTFYSIIDIIDKNEIEREKNAFWPRTRRIAKGLYVLNIDTFSKEAEMKLSRILGTGMILLFSLSFLLNKASRAKAAGHFDTVFVVSCSFLSFYRHIISTLRRIRVCNYLFLSNLHLCFIIFVCRSKSLISIGGGINDFNE